MFRGRDLRETSEVRVRQRFGTQIRITWTKGGTLVFIGDQGASWTAPWPRDASDPAMAGSDPAMAGSDSAVAGLDVAVRRERLGEAAI